MRVILSRKGFDSTAGKAPSPIVDGEPISLPIPTARRSETTYERAGVGELVERVTDGRICAGDLCHEDPVFSNGDGAFGQTGAAQSHLAKNGVGIGDVFLFFGLFASLTGEDRHHRIFGYLRVDKIIPLGRWPRKADNPRGFPRRHPHTIGEWNDNNTLYLGAGAKARNACQQLRLTKIGGPPSLWCVPEWFESVGLTYHANPDRWPRKGELRAAARGQEFIMDIHDLATPRKWLSKMMRAIEQ